MPCGPAFGLRGKLRAGDDRAGRRAHDYRRLGSADVKTENAILGLHCFRSLEPPWGDENGSRHNGPSGMASGGRQLPMLAKEGRVRGVGGNGAGGKQRTQWHVETISDLRFHIPAPAYCPLPPGSPSSALAGESRSESKANCDSLVGIGRGREQRLEVLQYPLGGLPVELARVVLQHPVQAAAGLRKRQLQVEIRQRGIEVRRPVTQFQGKTPRKRRGRGRLVVVEKHCVSGNRNVRESTPNSRNINSVGKSWSQPSSTVCRNSGERSRNDGSPAKSLRRISVFRNSPIKPCVS